MASRPTDPLTPVEREIVAGLDPNYAPLALAHRQRVLTRGVPYVFISGRRSRDEQTGLYHRQPVGVAAKPGTSKHEVGAAHDGSGPRTSDEWLVYGQEAEALGLEWGGRYPRPDLGHVESREERAVWAQSQALRVGAVLALLGAMTYIATQAGGKRSGKRG